MRFQINGTIKGGRRAVFTTNECEDKDEARHFFSHYLMAKDPKGKQVQIEKLDWRTLKPVPRKVK